MESIVIFGSGQIGHDALMFLGSENVDCFCDNDLSLKGIIKYDKEIISFEELKIEYQDAVVVIAVAEFNAYDIAKQCEENGLTDYLIYTFLRKAFHTLNGVQLLDFIENPINRMEIRKNIYLKRAEELEGQLQYFRKHADIRHMKPAEGELRCRQMRSVEASGGFFRKISRLGIKPILYAGNLLGYVRHNGFIPWDDDIDFALIRGDYEKLKEYCNLHIYTEEEFGRKADVNKDVPLEMQRYVWTLWHDHLYVGAQLEDGYCVGIDFFPLEYYADDYSLTELRELSSRLKTDLVALDTEKAKLQYIEKARAENSKITASESDYIYFGLDSMELWLGYHREQFIPRDVVFPLKEVRWEGECFWVPNNAEEFLTYEYECPWDFPVDVGISPHFRMSEDEEDNIGSI